MTLEIIKRQHNRGTFNGSLFLFLAFLLVGCASSGHKEAARFRKLLVADQMSEAKKMIADGVYYPGENSELLRLVEYGTILHLQGSYYQSLLVFDKAAELSQKLFTVSLSKKAGTYILSEKVDNYYGEKYERSAIRFYQALNHLILAKVGRYEEHLAPVWPLVSSAPPVSTNGKSKASKNPARKKVLVQKINNKKRLSHLRAARASIVAWDSLLDSYQAIAGGKDIYKEDMVSKVFGAWVHRSQKNRGDTNIAKGLYAEGRKLLFRNYNTYPTFNLKHKKFRSNFKMLPKLAKNKIEKEYISSTLYSTELKKLLNHEEKTLKSKEKNNVFFLVNEGFIGRKEAKKYNFPIGFNTLPIGVGIGNKSDFVSFVRKVLAFSSSAGPAISFELPFIGATDGPRRSEILIKDSLGKIVKKQELAVLNPMNDLAAEALGERNKLLRTKVGTRLAAKHIVALGSAFVTYRMTREKQGELMAMIGAGVMYAASNSLISSGESADLRYWSGLPAFIKGAHLRLKPGKYEAFVRSTTAAPKEVAIMKSLGPFEVKEGMENFIKKRLF